jgi:hypothetical protein
MASRPVVITARGPNRWPSRALRGAASIIATGIGRILMPAPSGV